MIGSILRRIASIKDGLVAGHSTSGTKVEMRIYKRRCRIVLPYSASAHVHTTTYFVIGGGIL